MKLVGGAIRAVSVEMIGVLFVLWIMFGAAGWTLDRTAADATRKTDRLLDWVSTQTGLLADRVAGVSRVNWPLRSDELASRSQDTASPSASYREVRRRIGDYLPGSWREPHDNAPIDRACIWFGVRSSHATDHESVVRPRGSFGSLLGGETDQDRIVPWGEERLGTAPCISPDCFARLLGTM